jgi:PAT family beta-lactamase induction signal transducer AmpG
VFLYRLGEGLILMEGQLFLQSPLSRGGLGLSAGDVSAIDAVWGPLFAMAGGLLGSLFAARLGLARSLAILGLCLNVPHLAYVYLSQIAADGQGASYLTIATMVSIEKFGYGFGFVGNMIYMMQQLAPGRCTMTHYAFATALMNLVLVPTNMISGPLAEWLGFSTFFLVVMIASVPSVWVAWKAPFPLATGDAATSASPDDPAGLSAAEQNVQVLAGRASLYAMLIILVLLIVDSRILGSLQGRSAGPAWIPFALLVASFGLKIFLAQRSWHFARATAITASEAAPASPYLANARGAKTATAISGVVSLVVLGAGAWLAL